MSAEPWRRAVAGGRCFRASTAAEVRMRSAFAARLVGPMRGFDPLAGKGYALALALTAALVLVLGPLGDPVARPLMPLFLVPVLAAAYVGGPWAGVFATVLTALASSYFRLPPVHSLRISLPADQIQWALHGILGIAISFALDAARRGRATANAARQRYSNVFARQLQASAAEAKATRFQRFTRNAPIGIVFSTSDGQIHFANDEYLRIIGRSREELESGWPPGEQRPFLAVQCAEDEDRCEREVVRRDGTRIPVLIGMSRHPDGLAAFVIDLTAEKRAQRALRESEERFRTLADNIAQLAWIADDAGRIVWHNQRWADYIGAVPKERETVVWRGALHPEHRARVTAGIRRCLVTGEIWEDTFPLRASDGVFRWFLSRGVPIRDESGKVTHWFGTSTDVTALRAVEEELKEANRRKSEFLAVLSHELRNPLAPIRNAVYILDHCDPLGAQARRAKVVVARQVNHLTRLVDDLLDVTRIARGKIELRRESVNLNELVRKSGDDHRELLQEHGLELSVTIPDEEVWIHGDVTRLSQIIGNLLQNATRFSLRGGSVELTLVAGDGWSEIHVKDQGVGIAPGMLERIFEPFVQGERTLARTQGGLGLGLALVKGLATLHGGSVHAASAGPGSGAELVVRLPTARPGTARAQPEARAAGSSGRRVRVLVVEDSREVAESLAQVIELLGHDVEIAHDGPTALVKGRAHPPDFVLCDIGLPCMSGYDVARAFAADPSLARTRLIAVSGYAQPEDRQEAAEAGFERHVAKPADPEELERLLST